MLNQRFDVRELTAFYLVREFLIQVVEVSYFSIVEAMVGNRTEAIVSWNLCNEVLAIVLPKGFDTSRDASLHRISVDKWLVHYLIIGSANTNKLVFLFHRLDFLFFVDFCFLCQLKCQVGIHDNLSPDLRDGSIDDAAALDTVGGWHAASEHLGDALDAVVGAFLNYGRCLVCLWLHAAANQEGQLFARHHGDGFLEQLFDIENLFHNFL